MTKKVFITGVAGFIGSSVAHALLDQGVEIFGIDNLNDYYDPTLKHARISRLTARSGFRFAKADIADHDAVLRLIEDAGPDVVVHLAAQAGVRYSITNPFAYAASNLTGHLSILEAVRRLTKRPRLVYASSSSVYGANAKSPFSESDQVNDPVSLYAATKRSDELMSEAYSRLYGIEQIGLRFFTVYGPWGRPDMAYWSFAEAILDNRPIRVFNNGDLKRDFTYIDDIVSGVVATAIEPFKSDRGVSHRIYNIGNNRPVELGRFIETLEAALGRKAVKEYVPMQAGDVYATCADISAISRDYGFEPTTTLETGIPKFVKWLRDWREAK